jgi:hypothetical protein
MTRQLFTTGVELILLGFSQIYLKTIWLIPSTLSEGAKKKSK